MENINKKIISAILFLVVVTFFSCEEEDKEESDQINPYVISYNPVSGVDGVSINSNIVLTFDDSVEKGIGNITITTDVEQGNQVIDINSDAVTVSNVGRIVTINPQDFLSGRDYEVVIDKGIVKDLAGNEYFGMPEEEKWTFKTGGNTGDLDVPAIESLSPTAGDTEGSITTLTLTFNEDVKTSTGNFVIYNTSDVAVATIDAEGDEISVAGTVITILLPEPLNFGTAYYVNFDAGVVKDIAGNNFAGYNDKTSWSFTTTVGSSTELAVYIPFDGSFADISGNKFDARLGATAIADVEFITDADRGEVVRFLAGSYAQLPKHDLLRPGADQDFSINVWLKLAGTDSDPAIIANSDWGSGGNPGILLCTDDGHEYVPGNGTEHGWIVNLAADPKDDARMDWRAAGTNPQAPALSDDDWHMVTIVIDQTNKNLHVYIDGTEYRNEGEASYHDLSTLSGPLYDVTNDYPFTLWEDATGKYNAGDERRAAMTGLMDDLRIYNKALSVDEITNLFGN